MKYGKRERISGAVILVALGVIFIPMLFDEPPARDERPGPVMTLGKPVDIDRSTVDAPQPPSELKIGTDVPITFVDSNGKVRDNTSSNVSDSGESRVAEANQLSAPQPAARTESKPVAKPESKPEPKSAPKATPTPTPKPKAVAPASAPSSSAGGWAVQVGSFGESSNAERLQQELQGKGFAAYRVARGSKLTVVFVGPYTSSEIGESARSRLQEQVNIKGLLVRRKEGE